MPDTDARGVVGVIPAAVVVDVLLVAMVASINAGRVQGKRVRVELRRVAISAVRRLHAQTKRDRSVW